MSIPGKQMDFRGYQKKKGGTTKGKGQQGCAHVVRKNSRKVQARTPVNGRERQGFTTRGPSGKRAAQGRRGI